MILKMQIYVGPYYVVQSDFDCVVWGDLVKNGRGLDWDGRDPICLVPNMPIEGIDREMLFGASADTHDPIHINPAMMVREGRLFSHAMRELVQHCDENDIEIHEAWGVVCGWF